MDVTDRKEAQERLLLLAREVDHRANNLLAVVQGAVQLTQAADVEAFRLSLQGRVGALAHAHRLLAENRWVGASLLRLIDEELRSFVTTQGVAVEGPDAELAPATAQALAMTLHELATNALKYGALSAPEGRLRIAWGPPNGDGYIDLAWDERGGPAPSPTRAGMGLTVIRRALAGPSGGEADIVWKLEGVLCRLRFPIAQS